MSDDDLDLDLDDELLTPARPVKAAKPAPAVKPAAVAAPAQPAAAKAVGSRPPGLLQRARACVKCPQFSGRTFLTILIALVSIVVLGENLAPVRCYFFGFAFELPKALACLIDAAFGAALMWWWLRRSAKPTEAEK